MMENFLDTCSKHDNVIFRDFGIYFSKYYANRIHSWALCFRGLCPPTNMTIESYHRLLKRHGGIMDSRTNVRMDTLLFHIETHLSMQATRIRKIGLLLQFRTSTPLPISRPIWKLQQSTLTRLNYLLTLQLIHRLQQFKVSMIQQSNIQLVQGPMSAHSSPVCRHARNAAYVGIHIFVHVQKL